MSYQSKYIAITCLLFVSGIYGVLFYTILSCQYNLDFASFYSSALASLHNKNPYQVWLSTYLPVTKELAVNLNPPIFLALFSPLAKINYPLASLIWFFLTFIPGLIAAEISFRYVFSKSFIQKNRLFLYLAYLAFFPTIMNVSIAQIGGILFLFMMLGYHYYCSKQDYLAGFFWGFIIAIKLFPGLLFLYVLHQRRINLFWIMLAVFCVCTLLPIVIYGPTIYSQYYSMMATITWYGDSWNASLYGFLLRIFTIVPAIKLSLQTIQIMYLLLFTTLLLIYLNRLGANKQDNHQPFCLTLVMMLLLSPLGWLYYFSLLLFPFLLIWANSMNQNHTNNSRERMWLLCLFFVSFPINNISLKPSLDIIDLFSFSSFYFYGLLLLAYLLMTKKEQLGNNDIIHCEKQSFLLGTLIILAFGLIVPSSGFFMRIENACRY